MARNNYKIDFNEQTLVSVLPPGIIPESVLNLIPDCTFNFVGNPNEGDILVYRSSQWRTEPQSIIAENQGYTGTVKLTIGPNQPSNPNIHDIWLDTGA